MTKAIYTLGDSWPNGAELDFAQGEKTYGELISDTLNINWIDYSECSTSIPHLILQAKQLLNCRTRYDVEIAIIFLTSPARDMYFDVDVPTELIPESQTLSARAYYKHLHSPLLEEYRTNTTILALQQMLCKAGITPVFLWGWDKVDLWVEPEYIYPISCAEMFDPEFTTIFELKNSQNKYIWPNMGHPNQLGHKLIADNLVKFLQEKFEM